MPKYIELKQNIINLIKEKDLKPGDLIPSTSGLENLYHVSTITIRKAIDELVNEGILYRVHGKGTYVAEQEDKFLEIYNVISNIFPKDMMMNRYSLFPQFLQILEKHLFENKMEMIISSHNYNEKLEKNILKHILKKEVDGLILHQSGNTSNIPYYSQIINKFPNSVFIDTYIPEINSNFVVTDNYNCSYNICQKLIENNIEKIYSITYSEVKGTSVFDRQKGIINCSKDNNIELVNIDYEFINYDDFKTRIYDFFSKEDLTKPFGVFLINAITTHYFYEVCKDLLKNKQWHVGTFEDPIDDFPNNVKIYWAEQNLEEMANEIINILKLNPIQKQHIYVPAIIHEK